MQTLVLTFWTQCFWLITDDNHESKNNTALFDDLQLSTGERKIAYNKGIMTVDVNGGNAERYTIEQGGELIFDTGLWKTKSNARNYDFDRFIVEFGPDQQTTFKFVPLPAGGPMSI